MLDTLPTELLELLFGYLCVNDRLQMSMVSKRMYNVFWQSPVGSDARKGITFRINSFETLPDLVNSRIFQMNTITELELDYVNIPYLDITHLMWEKWDLLAPQLFTLKIKHYRPLDIFRLLRNCSRLVTLNWTYRPRGQRNKERSPTYPEEDLDQVRLSGLQHLYIECIPVFGTAPKWNVTEFFDDFLSIAAAKSRLATLMLQGPVDFKVLLRHVTLHATSLKSLNISGSSITGEQLVTLGSIPDLRLLDLDISFCKEIDLGSFVQFLRLQPNLESLNLNGCEDTILAEESWNTFKNEFAFYLSGLKSLNVGSSSTSKFSDFIPQLSHLQQLISIPESCDAQLAPSLNRSSCTLKKAKFSLQEVLLLHDDHLRNLRELSLFGYRLRKMPNPNEVYFKVWQNCPNMEILNISSLTFDADNPMAVSCNNLRKLNDLTMSLQMSNGWTDSLSFLLRLPNIRRLEVRFQMSCDDSLQFGSLSAEDLIEFNRHLAIKTPFLESLCFCDAHCRVITHIDVIQCAELWPRMKAT